jgi:pyrroloquinoline quinone biosynthesis protein D
MALSDDPVLALHSDAALRAVSGEGVVLMVTTGQIYTCNETAMNALSRMDGVAPLSKIAGDMAGEYDVDPDVLKADVAELLAYLHAEGVLVHME